MIPRKFHTLWVQGPPLPDQHQTWFDSWLKHNSDWEHCLWSEGDYLPLIFEDGVESVYASAVNHAQRAEIARYSILFHEGGVVLDADFECLRQWDFLDGIDCFAAEESPGQLTMSILGAVPQHSAVRLLVEGVEAAIEWQRFQKLPQTYGAGPHYIERNWRNRHDVTIYGPELFFPYLWNQTKPTDFDDAYAAHHWTASWKQ